MAAAVLQHGTTVSAQQTPWKRQRRPWTNASAGGSVEGRRTDQRLTKARESWPPGERPSSHSQRSHSHHCHWSSPQSQSPTRPRRRGNLPRQRRRRNGPHRVDRPTRARCRQHQTRRSRGGRKMTRRTATETQPQTPAGCQKRHQTQRQNHWPPRAGAEAMPPRQRHRPPLACDRPQGRQH